MFLTRVLKLHYSRANTVQRFRNAPYIPISKIDTCILYQENCNSLLSTLQQEDMSEIKVGSIINPVKEKKVIMKYLAEISSYPCNTLLVSSSTFAITDALQTGCWTMLLHYPGLDWKKTGTHYIINQMERKELNSIIPAVIDDINKRIELNKIYIE